MVGQICAKLVSAFSLCLSRAWLPEDKNATRALTIAHSLRVRLDHRSAVALVCMIPYSKIRVAAFYSACTYGRQSAVVFIAHHENANKAEKVIRWRRFGAANVS